MTNQRASEDELDIELTNTFIAEYRSCASITAGENGLRFFSSADGMLPEFTFEQSWDDALLMSDPDIRFYRGGYSLIAETLERLAKKLREFEATHSHELEKPELTSLPPPDRAHSQAE